MEGEEPIRVLMPKGGQLIGEVVELLGASRFRVRCQDGKTRTCRIPGKFRKRINITAGNLVLVEPWSIEPDAKGDIVWIYNKTHANWLRSKGYFK